LDTVLCVANALVTGPSDSSPKSMLSKDITAIQKVVLYSAKNALAEKNDLSFKDFSGETLLTISAVNKPYALEENGLLCNKYGFGLKL
jgi:hypothetical protein